MLEHFHSEANGGHHIVGFGLNRYKINLWNDYIIIQLHTVWDEQQ